MPCVHTIRFRWWISMANFCQRTFSPFSFSIVSREISGFSNFFFSIFRILKNRFFDSRNGSSTNRYKPVYSIYDQLNYEAWHIIYLHLWVPDPTTGKIIQNPRCIWNDYFYTYGCLVPLI